MKYNLKNEYKRNLAIKTFKRYLDSREYIKLEKIPTKRTLQANKLYWVWLNCIGAETGNDKDELHLYFKSTYLGTYEKQVLGSTVTDIKSTSDLDSKEFTEYMNKIKDFALNELSVILLSPGDKYFDEFYKEYI